MTKPDYGEIDYASAKERGIDEFDLDIIYYAIGLDNKKTYKIGDVEKKILEADIDVIYCYPSIIKSLLGEYNFTKLVEARYDEIVEDPNTSYWYAQDYSDDRFKDGEKAIAKDAHASLNYASHVLKTPFKLGEKAIAKESSFSYLYAQDVLKGRFKKGEKAIAKHAIWSYNYATMVLKGRFKLGEKAIASNAAISYFYAKDVIEGRFELGEETILNNRWYRSMYRHFLSTIGDSNE